MLFGLFRQNQKQEGNVICGESRMVKKITFRSMLRGAIWLTALPFIIGLSNIPLAQANELSDWLSQPTMTGNWGGVRTSLQSLGITPHAYDYTEFAWNLSGGKSRGSATSQQFGFGVDFDLGKLAGITGGTIHLQLNDRFGESTSANNIGNEMPVQNVFGLGENFRLTQFSYEQLFDHKKIQTEIGFFPAGNYFGNFVDIGCHFQNTAFCGHVEGVFFNSGAGIYPVGKWGGMIKVYPTTTTYAETGVWDVNPTYALPQNGFKISLNGSTGAYLPVEFGWTPNLGPDNLPGHYKIGGYYDTSTVAEVGSPDIMQTGRYGGYVMADQMLFSLAHGTSRGLIAFAEGSVSDQRTAPIPFYYTFGLILQGPIAARPGDYVSIGVARSLVNKRATRAAITLAPEIDEAQAGETDLEFDYGIRLAPWLLITPNVQYIGSPGAFSSKPLKNAWVLASQAQINF
jgi:porin